MMEAVENLALKNILLDAAAKEFEEELHEKEPVVVSVRLDGLRTGSGVGLDEVSTKCSGIFFDMFCSGWIDYGSESDCPCCYYYLGH